MTEGDDGRGGGGDGLAASTSERRDFPAFPFEPYPIQLDLMRGLYRTLERGGIGVFESPTGTGKTLSVLCSALQWLEDHRRRMERGEGGAGGDPFAAGGANGGSAATRKDDDEPDWLRDYEKDKSARDFAERMKRRLERRRNARRAAAAVDAAFFAGQKRREKTERERIADREKADRERTITAGGTIDDAAAEEAEFLADDWDDDAPPARSVAGGSNRDLVVSDDDSTDDERDDRGVRKKRARRAGGALVKLGHDSDDDSEDSHAPLQVIFCSRTHSQLTQVVGELNRTSFGGEDGTVNAVAVASRAQLCVNPEARAAAGASAARLNERCLELGKPKAKGERARKGGEGGGVGGRDGADGADKPRAAAGSGCPYLKKRHAAVADLADAALAAPMDIEDLAAAGTRHRACAYYAARKALPRADLVFAPYASLLHKETRESLGINLKGSVVVFDEAHNLVEAVHGAHGSVLTGKQCEAVHAMVTAYVDRFYTRLAVGNLRHLKTLGALARGFAAALGTDKGTGAKNSSNDSSNAAAAIGEVKSLNDFLFQCGADNVNFFALRRYLRESKIAHKIAGYGEHVARSDSSGASSDRWNWEDDAALGVGVVSDKQTSANQTSANNQAPRQPRVGSVHALAAFVSALASADADGRVLVERGGEFGGRLKFVLLDAAARFKQIVDDARAVVLVGGTLAPIPELAAQLFPDAVPEEDGTFEGANDEKSSAVQHGKIPRTLTTLSCGHVVPRDALLPLAVARGPSGRALDYSFGSRSAPEMIDELGRLLANACRVAPGGVVVFFPSFAYADDVYDRWVKTGVNSEIARHKAIFREPRAAAKVEKVLRDFATSVRNGEERRRAANAAHSGVSENGSGGVSSVGSSGVPAGRTGAVMLCVCGGKLSEGINFKDELGRLVVMVGLPYANPEEPELKARMRHLDLSDRKVGSAAEPPAGGKSRGRAYYEALCMRAVNQSVGRAIRHVGDYAAIVFVDGRYAPPGAETGRMPPLGVSSQLPEWIQERLVIPRGYGEVQSGLVRFFRAHAEKERAGASSGG